MHSPIRFQPTIQNYLAFHIGLILVMAILSRLFVSIVYHDRLPTYLAVIPILGYCIGLLLMAGYDALTRFQRLAVVVTEQSISANNKTLSRATLDKARTSTHNSQRGLLDRVGRTTYIWSTNGDAITINGFLYSASQIKAILEEIGCGQKTGAVTPVGE